MNFTRIVEFTAQTIVALHERFDIELGHHNDRLALLTEEFLEHARECNKGDEDRILEELADVIYVALGTLQLAGDKGSAALRAVALKNSRKTLETHETNPITGKIQRKESP